MRFPEYVMTVLENAGWHEGRRIGDDEMEPFERAHDGALGGLHEYGRAFLAEFGGLQLSYPSRRVARLLQTEIAEAEKARLARLQETPLGVSFDPVVALDYINVSWPARYAEQLHEQVNVVGWSEGDASLLMLSRKGCAYVGTGSWLAKIAESPDAAVVAILDSSDPLEIIDQ